MCGIVGFVGPPEPALLVRMRDAVWRRGPDEAGVFEDSRVSLGHRRLSIVDLSAGAQPAFNEDGSIAIVFNGEVYNHPALMSELRAAGHVYKSHCDTESVVHAYEQYGVNCVDVLHGMFAFVLYDKNRRLLFGARDRLGKKPLYYSLPNATTAAHPASFLFASELKALRVHPALAKPTLSETALIDYLCNDYVVGDRCIDANVWRLKPGHAFCFGLPDSSEPGFKDWKYWEPRFRPVVDCTNVTEAIGKTRSLLFEATKARLMADVPVGCFLSGGIDSSALVSMLRRQLPGERIATFSIGFDEPSFDESSFSQAIAAHFGTRHHCRRFTVNELLNRLEAVGQMLDEPLADPSILPVSLLSEFAAEHVKVALGGDGGDELFAGYDPFRAIGPAIWYAGLAPKTIHRFFVKPLAKLLPASGKNMSLGFRVERFLRGFDVPAEARVPTWMGAFSLPQLECLLPEWRSKLKPEAVFAEQFTAWDRVRRQGGDEMDAALDFFERFYLPDDILVKVDRGSMMHSLEVRCPYLDTALVEFVNRLPNHWKLRGGTTKWLFRQAMSSRIDAGPGKRWQTLPLPDFVLRRKKKGFGIPVAAWIKRELAATFRNRLVEEWPASLGMFNQVEIRRLLDAHQSGRANCYKELWALLMLAEWSRHHG